MGISRFCYTYKLLFIDIFMPITDVCFYRIVEKKLLSAKEAAAFLGIARKTLYNELSAGKFPVKPKRRGRKLLFERKNLDKYADSL